MTHSPRLSCSICKNIDDFEIGFQKVGCDDKDAYITVDLAQLETVKAHGQRKLLRCPQCGTRYLYEESYEFLVNGSEDEQTLTRLKKGEHAW